MPRDHMSIVNDFNHLWIDDSAIFEIVVNPRELLCSIVVSDIGPAIPNEPIPDPEVARARIDFLNVSELSFPDQGQFYLNYTIIGHEAKVVGIDGTIEFSLRLTGGRTQDEFLARFNIKAERFAVVRIHS